MRYDDRYHLHLGYYKNGHDLEAIALKREDEAVWDVFFNFAAYGLPSNVTEGPPDELGTRIFSIHQQELDFEAGSRCFSQWLSGNRLIE